MQGMGVWPVTVLKCVCMVEIDAKRSAFLLLFSQFVGLSVSFNFCII